MLDSIGEARISISEEVDPDLGRRETLLRAQSDAKSEEYTQLLSVDPSSSKLAKLNDELRRLRADDDELQGQLRVRNPRYATLVQPQPLGLEEIQRQVLDGDSILLEYALGDEKSYLWVVSRNEFTSYVLPRRSEIEKKVLHARSLMTARVPLPRENAVDFQMRNRTAESEYPKAAADLSRILLGPAADRLTKRRLVIVGESVLQYLPFGALPTPQSLQGSSPIPLIMEHEIVNLPSASTLAVIRRGSSSKNSPRPYDCRVCRPCI